MDAGMNLDTVMTVDNALRVGKLPVDLSASQILNIMDELMACEATFHNGQSLGHSVFICLYLHRLSLIKDTVFLAWARCFLRSCEYVRAAVAAADIYEEEDFATLKFHYTLAEDVPPADILAAIDAAIYSVSSSVTSLQNEVNRDSASTDLSSVADVPLDSNLSLEQNVAILRAILFRLNFRKALFLAYFNLSIPELKGLSSVQGHLDAALGHLELVSTSLTVETAVGFEPSCSRPLFMNAPPRACQIMSRPAAVKHFKQFLTTLTHLKSLLQLRTFDDLMRFFQCFSSLRPNIIARSILFSSLTSEENFVGLGPVSSLLKKSFTDFSSSATPHMTGESFQIYFSRLLKPACILFRLNCENLSRQQQRIPKLISDWAVLQQVEI